jgi:hypothetical protein
VRMSRRQQRTLRGIELDLAASDPGVHSLFLSFNSRAGRSEMPPAEHVARWPSRMLARLWCGRSVPGRVRDWCAENWNYP